MLYIQLRIRDLESALDMEKTAKTDAHGNIEKVNKQLRWVSYDITGTSLIHKMALEKTQNVMQVCI